VWDWHARSCGLYATCHRARSAVQCSELNGRPAAEAPRHRPRGTARTRQCIAPRWHPADGNIHPPAPATVAGPAPPTGPYSGRGEIRWGAEVSAHAYGWQQYARGRTGNAMPGACNVCTGAAIKKMDLKVNSVK